MKFVIVVTTTDGCEMTSMSMDGEPEDLIQEFKYQDACWFDDGVVGDKSSWYIPWSYVMRIEIIES